MKRPDFKPSQKNDNSDQMLRKVAHEIRKSRRFPSLLEVLKAARERGIGVSWVDLLILSDEVGERETLIVPPSVTDFIAACFTTKKPKRALDPCAGVGSLLQQVVKACRIREAVGIARSKEELEFATLMDSHGIVEWLLDDPGGELEKLARFDLVISTPTLGDPSRILNAVKAASRLADSGEAAFILPISFFFSMQSRSARELLRDLGLHINAIIALPAGTFAPLTSIELNLVFMSRERTADVFVGRLNPDREPTALLNNFRKRKPGPLPELGRLVQVGDYRGWHALAAQEEQQRLAERSGLKAVPLTEIVEEINLGKRSEDGDFEDVPNCVYLPLIGTAPAVTALSDLQIKAQNYVQLVVRPEKAHAEFLAEFFNSPLGRRTRDGLHSGTVIPKISKQTLIASTIYTLPIEAQKEAAEVNREIKELRLRLDEIDRELWRRPVDANKIQKSVEKLNRDDSFKAWVDSLPFPLASILSRYDAPLDVARKTDHLFNFFEAAAQFLGTLMTSAFHSNKAFFHERKRHWFDSGKDGRHSLFRSSFGEWVVRCQRLARTTRTLLSDKNSRQLCLNLWGTYDPEKVETIANKNIYSILETVSRYRNDWKGHGGFASLREVEVRLTRLEQKLADFRKHLGAVFEDWWLIRPGKNEFVGGIYDYQVEKLMGSNTIFKQERLETSIPMDCKELYLIDTTTRQPLQILHFFRMMSVPKSEKVACYFFNRVESEGVRWISYHFEDEPDKNETDDSVLKVIAEIEKRDE